MKITRYKAYDKAPVVGFLDIEIEAWHMEIRGITLMQKDGKRWFAMPSKAYEGDDGTTKYSPVVKFTEDSVFKRFMGSLKTVFEEYCKTQPEQQQESSSEELPF